MSHAWTVCLVAAGSLLTGRRMTDWTHTANAAAVTSCGAAKRPAGMAHCVIRMSHAWTTARRLVGSLLIALQGEPCVDLSETQMRLTVLLFCAYLLFEAFIAFCCFYNLHLQLFKRFKCRFMTLYSALSFFRRAISASGNSCFCNHLFFGKISTVVQSIVLR